MIYIFVLCPPYQGSTILTNLINTSPNVSSLLDNQTWPTEVQWLLEKYGDVNYRNNRWDPEYKLDMDLVNNILNKYLDNTKMIFLEKSPPTICRAKLFEEYFSKLGKVYFVLSMRNPYSTRYGAKKWIECAKYQKYNIENLENVIITSYEECCLNTEVVIKKLLDKIPELGNIKNVKLDNDKNEKLGIIHKDKINRVINKEEKNEILKNNIDLLEYFGYVLLN